MEELLEDVNEAISILRIKRMSRILKTDKYLKELSDLENTAEKRYNELDLDKRSTKIIEELISCKNAVDEYCEQLNYLQGLRDGANLSKFRDALYENAKNSL